MNLPENTFKKNLKEAGSKYGLWLGLPDSICAEICATAGFDWVLVDAEHAPYSLRDIQHHLQAIEPYHTPALVRPPEGRTALLKQITRLGRPKLVSADGRHSRAGSSSWRKMFATPRPVYGAWERLWRERHVGMVLITTCTKPIRKYV